MDNVGMQPSAAPGDASANFRGDVRRPGGTPAPATISLGPGGFSVSTAGAAPWDAAYRDLGAVVLDAGTALVELDAGTEPERWLFERFGPALAALVRGLRDGRLRQWLTDGLVELDGDAPPELIEIAVDAATGVAQVLHDRRGVAVAPLDERSPRFRIRRSDIGPVEAETLRGRVRIAGIAGSLAMGRARTGTGGAGAPARLDTLELRGLGAAATRESLRWMALRDGAAADQAAILGTLIPDAPLEVRRRAAGALREGVPVDAAALGDAWPVIEAAVLVDPGFAASYRSLVTRAGGDAAPRWLAIAPERPGAAPPGRAWFLVGLPGNLVALELVSSGAHATYLFRAAPRATFDPARPDAAATRATVTDVSEALLDSRFLREPMALPADQLATPEHLRYRLALAALPSLAAARSRFVARLVHRDEATWAAALDDVIAWHGSTRDDTAGWPGRATQESMIEPTS